MIHAVPSLEAVTAAYVADEIDAIELEDLIGAALEGRKVSIPHAVWNARYRADQALTRFSSPHTGPTSFAPPAYIVEGLGLSAFQRRYQVLDSGDVEEILPPSKH